MPDTPARVGPLRSFALGLLGARREVRAGPEALVVSRPFLARGKPLFDAIEAAKLAAEVVDRVDQRRLAGAGHDRTAVLERPVVTEDDVQERPFEVRREPVEPLDCTPDAVVAERDLTE